jgi:glucose-1-phosphate thymidylyltransferase
MEIIGVLPCGGLGLRMRPLRYPKELLPITYEISTSDNSVRPRLSIEHSLEAFKSAGINKCCIVIPDWKPELMRYLGNGEEFGMDIAYIYNSNAYGLADAIFTCFPWLCEQVTCMAMPDTQFYPQNSFEYLLKETKKNSADLVLGIYPTTEPHFFAPVEVEKSGKVISIVDKPPYSDIMNTWGIAVWTPVFWKFFKKIKETLVTGVSISDVFQKAVTNGLNVQGIYFVNGVYHDIGKIDRLPFILKEL